MGVQNKLMYINMRGVFTVRSRKFKCAHDSANVDKPCCTRCPSKINSTNRESLIREQKIMNSDDYKT